MLIVELLYLITQKKEKTKYVNQMEQPRFDPI
jgi:hypothetical protein